MEFPEDLELVETINVPEPSRGRILKVNRIYPTPRSKTDYFGVILKYSKTPPDLGISMPIKITLDTGTEAVSKQAYAKIFRPSLSIDQIPPRITIPENHDAILPIHLKYGGFGDVSIRISGSIGGKIVTKGGQSPVDLFFDELIEEGLIGKILEDDPLSGTDLDEERLAALDAVKDKMKNKDYVAKLLLDRQLHNETVAELRGFSKSEREKFMNALYNTLETSLLKKISDILSKNITSKARLDSGTEISMELRAEITDLNLKIFYRDLMGNVYPPLVADVKIVDKRSNNAPVSVSIPIEIEKLDESKAFKNVAGMRLGSGS